jgi:hypothetical protein
MMDLVIVTVTADQSDLHAYKEVLIAWYVFP